MVTSLVHCGQWWYWLCHELLWPCLMGLPCCYGIGLKHEFHQLVDCCLGRYFSFVVGQGGLSYPYTILAYFQFSHTRYVAQASRHHTQTDTIITVKAVWSVCCWSSDQMLSNGVHYTNIFDIMYIDGSLLYISKEWRCSLLHSLPCSYGVNLKTIRIRSRTDFVQRPNGLLFLINYFLKLHSGMLNETCHHQWDWKLPPIQSGKNLPPPC